MTAEIVPLLVNAVWGGLFAAVMSMLFQAPASAILPCFVAGFAGRLARNLLLVAGAGPHLTTFLAAMLVGLLPLAILIFAPINCCAKMIRPLPPGGVFRMARSCAAL